MGGEEAEEWRPVKGFEGFYEISNLGNLRSLDRVVQVGKGKRLIKGKPLVRSSCSNGYKFHHISGNGVKKNALIHRLVAEAFIPNPYNLPEVNHIDEDRTNNRVDNLEWVTRSQNLNHGNYQIRKALSQGKPVIATFNGCEVARFGTEGIAARMVGGSQDGISLALRGEIKEYKGFGWEYADERTPAD